MAHVESNNTSSNYFSVIRLEQPGFSLTHVMWLLHLQKGATPKWLQYQMTNANVSAISSEVDLKAIINVGYDCQSSHSSVK